MCCQCIGYLPATLQGGDDVGLIEIVPLKEERLPGKLGEGISEAVAEVQPGRMAALAEIVERLPCDVRLFDRHRLNHDGDTAKNASHWWRICAPN